MWSEPPPRATPTGDFPCHSKVFASVGANPLAESAVVTADHYTPRYEHLFDFSKGHADIPVGASRIPLPHRRDASRYGLVASVRQRPAPAQTRRIGNQIAWTPLRPGDDNGHRANAPYYRPEAYGIGGAL